MRAAALLALTWATIAAAIACAAWLVHAMPARPFGAPHQDASVGVVVDVADLSLDDAPPAAGPAASSPR